MLKQSKYQRIITFCAALGVAAALPVYAGDKEKEHEDSSKSHQTSGSKMTDKKFVEEAMQGNQAEIAIAQVAARKAQNPEVKQFAQQLQQDHTQANQQLQPIAQQLGVSTTQTLEQKHQKELDRLQALQGEQFDKEFVKHSLRDHRKDVSKYQKAQSQVQNPQLTQYINQTLPKLQQHLQHTRQLAQTVGIDQSTLSEIDRETPEAVGGTGEEMEQDDLPDTSKGAGGKELKNHDTHHDRD